MAVVYHKDDPLRESLRARGRLADTSLLLDVFSQQPDGIHGSVRVLINTTWRKFTCWFMRRIAISGRSVYSVKAASIVATCVSVIVRCGHAYHAEHL